MFAENISILAQVESESGGSTSLMTIIIAILIVLSLTVPLLLSPKSKKREQHKTNDRTYDQTTEKSRKVDLNKTSGYLTAENVILKQFSATKFREGYDQENVDDFLDEVVAELRRIHEENESLKLHKENKSGSLAPISTPILTPEAVVNKRFKSTKFREGYDQDELDDFLDEVVVTLRDLTAENNALQGEISENLM